VLGTNTTLSTTSTELLLYRFPFASAVLLEAGKTYPLASGTATTANRVAVISRGGSSGWDLNAPGETSWGTPQLDSISVGVGRRRRRSGRVVSDRCGTNDCITTTYFNH
jgi:hypothetical protein